MIPGVGALSMATGINAGGIVVGAMSIAGDQNEHAFYNWNGKVYDAGTLGGSASYATAVNDAGTIVGTSTLKGDGTFHAFSYAQGKMRDIGTLPGLRTVLQRQSIPPATLPQRRDDRSHPNP